VSTSSVYAAGNIPLTTKSCFDQGGGGMWIPNIGWEGGGSSWRLKKNSDLVYFCCELGCRTSSSDSAAVQNVYFAPCLGILWGEVKVRYKTKHHIQMI